MLPHNWDKTKIIIFMVFFGCIGAYLLFRSFAQVPSSLLERPTPKDIHQKVVSDEVLVKLKPESHQKIVGIPKVAGLLKETDLKNTLPDLDKKLSKVHSLGFKPLLKQSEVSNKDASVFRWYVVKLPAKTKNKFITTKDKEFSQINNTIDLLRQDQSVEAVEPNGIIETSVVPNDPYYSSSGVWSPDVRDMWGLQKIDAEHGWNVTTGSKAVIVADVDTGVDRNHPDLAQNMWVNTKEIKGNGIDDDKNGYIDDYYGWDFANNDNDPIDDNGHGTHTSGTIAAAGNNSQGVVGVSWKTKIMPVKFLTAQGYGGYDAAANALVYAADMGAKVSSNSWGGGPSSQIITDAINYETSKGMTIVAAAGNYSENALYESPANLSQVITVAASGASDQKACFSNYGAKIDVAAPGGDSSNCGGKDDYILSTRSAVSDPYFKAIDPAGRYAGARGTSMATPHVAGLVSLILAKYPSATPEQIRQVIRAGSDDLGSPGQDDSYGFGRINLAKTLAKNPSTIITPIITSPVDGTLLTADSHDIIGSANGTGFASYTLELSPYGKQYETLGWKTLKTSTTPVTNGKLGDILGADYSDGIYTLRLTVTDTTGAVYRAQLFNLEIDNFDGQLSSPMLDISQGINDVLGWATVKNGMEFANYTLEWGEGNAPTSWQTTGITLTGDGKTAVTPDVLRNYGSKLATWDTKALQSGKVYTLRLVIYSKTGKSDLSTRQVQVDKDIAPGWPKVACAGIGFDTYGCNHPQDIPTFADLDGDKKQEIIVADNDHGTIDAYHIDGSVVNGFPYKVPGILNWDDNSINAADLNNDGKMELIFGVMSGSVPGTVNVIILNGDGTAYPGWKVPTIYSDRGGWSQYTPTVANIDGTGNKEIIIFDRPDIQTDPSGGAYTGRSRLNVFDLTGTQLTGFPKIFNHTPPPAGDRSSSGGILFITAPDPEYPPAVVADVNGDSKPEIIWSISNQVFVFDAGGNILPGWPYTAPNDPATGYATVFGMKPVVGDLDGDGKLEIVTIAYDELEDNYDSRVFAFTNAGGLISGWPKNNVDTLSATLFNSPAIADLDNDGKDDIITNQRVKVDDYTSNVLPKIYFGNQTDDSAFKTAYSQSAGFNRASNSPIIIDHGGDGKLDILVQSYYTPSGFQIYNSQGQKLWEKLADSSIEGMFNGPFFLGGSVVTNANNNADLYLAHFGQVYNGYWSDEGWAQGEQLYLWKIPNPSTAKRPVNVWPQVGQNSQLTGRQTDKTPPSAPSNLNATTVTSSQVNLQWTVSKDNVAVKLYEVYRNGKLLATSTSNSFGDATVAAGKTYTYKVRAKDAAGNYSAFSNAIDVQTPAPAYSGVITGVVKADGVVVADATVSLTFSGQNHTYVTDAKGVYKITGLPAGTYSVTYAKTGYKSQVLSITVADQQTVTKNVTLVK